MKLFISNQYLPAFRRARVCPLVVMSLEHVIHHLLLPLLGPAGHMKMAATRF